MLRRLSLLGLLVVSLTLGTVAPALAGTESDEAIAQDTILTEDDVASFGLTESEPGDSSAPNVPACKQIRAADKAAGKADNAESYFEDGAGTNLGNKVIVFSSVKAAKAQIAAYSSSKAAKCLEATIKQSLEENLPGGSSYEFSGDKAPVPLGDDAVVYTIQIDITGPEGDESTSVLEAGIIRVANGLIQVDTFAPDAPFAGSEAVASELVDRLTQSLA